MYCLQQKVLALLKDLYVPKKCVHGFTKNRGIRTNADGHIGNPWVLNVDIKDFFPSIKFKRIWGMLKKKPYYINEDVAKFISQMCCYKQSLPAGGPCSPILSNMLCGKLDSALVHLANNNKPRCYYTRYADDLTFSTKSGNFPKQLAKLKNKKTFIGKELHETIIAHGFKLNPEKSRLMPFYTRQEVTGIKTNVKANVPKKLIAQIRAMLHAWKKHEYEAAQNEFIHHWDSKKRLFTENGNLFAQVVRGKIEYLGSIRGKLDRIYIKYMNQYKKLRPDCNWQYRGETPEARIANAVWIVECGTKAGTAFYLKDIGFVTCSHIFEDEKNGLIDDKIELYHFSNPAQKLSATILKRSPSNRFDVAILDTDPSLSIYPLTISEKLNLNIGTNIFSWGHPQHRAGDSGRWTGAEVTGSKGHYGIWRYYIERAFLCGNSGGPVFIKGTEEVVGLVLGGDETIGESSRTGFSMFQSIEALKKL